MTLVLSQEAQEGWNRFTIELPKGRMTDAEFYEFCRLNPNHKFEKEPDGQVNVMPNTGGKTGKRNSKLTTRLTLWEEANGGNAFDSSTAFRLPNGATRSPDAAWMSNERWNALTDEEQERFPPIAPDFVVELMSPSDDLKKAQNKMLEWIENGVRLGWLLKPSAETAFIYRADGTISKVNSFD